MRIRKRLIGSILLCLILVIAVFITVIRDKRHHMADSGMDISEEEITDTDQFTVNGVNYEKNYDIRTVLFLGIDKDAVTDFDKVPGENGQSDSINLAVMNEETRQAEIIQISRDTMVDVEVYDEDGEFREKKQGQITLQYAYGDGKDFSCRLTCERVSELLYGVDVNNYFALTLDGMTYIADAIGGVPITVPQDYTEIEPVFEEGAEIVLDGELTERYVRYRDRTDVEGNIQRVERQAQFIKAFMTKVWSMDEDEMIDVYQELEPYMITNMAIDELVRLEKYTYAEEINMVEGESKVVDNYVEFYADNEKLQKKVLDLFYNQI